MTFLLVLGCTTTNTDTVGQRCVVDAVAAVTEVRPGDTVTLTGGPYSTPNDTRVILGELDVAALEVVRDGCTICDACRDEFRCDPGCDASCASCVEVTTFVLPDSVVPGPIEAVVVNRWGASSPIALTVLGSDTDL